MDRRNSTTLAALAMGGCLALGGLAFGQAGGYETWFGMFAPKGTPAPIVKKLNADFTAIVKAPEFAEKYLRTKGFEPEGDSADHFAQFIQDDLRKAKDFVGITGVTLEQR